MIPEPEIAHRSWTFVYKRPQRMGWPLLTRTGLPSAAGTPRPAKTIAPKRLRIVVRQAAGEQPYVDSVSVTGNWADSGKPTIGMKVHTDLKPGMALVVYADDTVRELMADAVRRATEEISAAIEIGGW